MANKELVTKVWIEPGCIVCDACETACPEVFEVQHDNETCIVRPEALDVEFNKPLSPQIVEAAEECPVDVIKFETVTVQVADEAVTEDPAEQVEQSAAQTSADQPSAQPTPAKVAPPAPKRVELPKAKELDPAVQALLEATTVRGGHVMINREVKDLPEVAKAFSKLSPDKLPADARYQRVLEKTKQAKGEPSRRDWLLGGAWITFAAGFGALPMAALGRFMMPNVLEQEDPRVHCGPLSKFEIMQPGEVNEDFMQVKPSGFWIIREEERIAALSIICTHLGCIPAWLPNDRKFKCPCHGSGFKPDGVNFEGPAPRPLERFKITLEGNEVVVDRAQKFLAMGPSDTGVWNDPEASILV